MPAPAKPFGRRNLPAAHAAAAPAQRFATPRSFSQPIPPEGPLAEAGPAAPPASEAYRQFAAAIAEERKNAGKTPKAGSENAASPSTPGVYVVPKSMRATLLAGLVTAFLQIGISLGTTIALGQRLGTLSIGGQNLPVVSLILFGALWSGARSSAFGLFFVHGILSPLGMTHHAAYAMCGGLVALAYAFLAQALGLGDTSTLAADIAAGVASGFFYRLFAGARPA